MSILVLGALEKEFRRLNVEKYQFIVRKKGRQK